MRGGRPCVMKRRGKVKVSISQPLTGLLSRALREKDSANVGKERGRKVEKGEVMIMEGGGEGVDRASWSHKGGRWLNCIHWK